MPVTAVDALRRRAVTVGAAGTLCLLALAGCTASQSHHDAAQSAIWGFLGGATVLGLAALAWRNDSGGSRAAAAAGAVLGVGGLIWAANGMVALYLPEPVPGTGAYQCAVRADQHVLVTVKNVGATTLVVGSVQVQLEDGAGRAQGDQVNAFLPVVFKMPQQFAAGDRRTFDLGALTGPGQPMPARCEVTAASKKSGVGRGSILSGW